MAAFVFKKYHVEQDGRMLSFSYGMESTQYTEHIVLPRAIPHTKKSPLLDALLFNLHLALGISYWKSVCTREIVVESGELSSAQAAFWNIVYTKGLGEFYFRNKIDFRGLVNFPVSDNAKHTAVSFRPSATQLVGIGGGKDSVLVWEMLKRKKIPAQGLIIKTQHAYDAVETLVSRMQIPTVSVERMLDPAFLAAAPGYPYNGHVPISMIYAWIGMLVCYLYNYAAFVVANEASSDEGNTEYLGMQINHQWSKTGEFERLFSEYVRTCISPDLTYYSPIRTLTELEVVAEVVKYPKYLNLITSCNRNFSIGRRLTDKHWCGECPKCAFAFLMFAAHLPKKDVISMFGSDMFSDSHLIGLFRDLGGRGGLKPFECVGTFDEVQEALRLIRERGEFTIPDGLVTGR